MPQGVREADDEKFVLRSVNLLMGILLVLLPSAREDCACTTLADILDTTIHLSALANDRTCQHNCDLLFVAALEKGRLDTAIRDSVCPVDVDDLAVTTTWPATESAQADTLDNHCLPYWRAPD